MGKIGFIDEGSADMIEAGRIDVDVDDRIDPEQRAGLLIDYLKELRGLNQLAVRIPIETVEDRIARTCEAIENVLEVKK